MLTLNAQILNFAELHLLYYNNEENYDTDPYRGHGALLLQ